MKILIFRGRGGEKELLYSQRLLGVSGVEGGAQDARKISDFIRKHSIVKLHN